MSATTSSTSLPTEGYVRLPQILAVLPLCRTTFLQGVDAGLYPKPYRIGKAAVAWKVEEIRKMLESFEQVA